MLMERPASWIATWISVAIIVPEYAAVLKDPVYVPSYLLLIAAFVGSAGIFMGGAVVSTFAHPAARIARLAIWLLIALGMTAALVFCAMRGAVWWRSILFFAAASLPLLTFIFSAWEAKKANE